MIIEKKEIYSIKTDLKQMLTFDQFITQEEGFIMH